FFNQGQICMSTERILVEESVVEPFIARFRAEAEKLRYQPGDAPLGTLISAAAAVRVRSMVDDALGKGAVLITGGEHSDVGLQPTILDRVVPGMRLYSEEAFGPIAGIVHVGDRDEALAIANDTDFGLVASVFSADTDAALALLQDIETGIGHVNGSTVFDDPAMPFGGVKDSGYGRFGGTEALGEFTECQWIAIHDTAEGDGPRETDVQ
ncbi:MAG: aldehyde dehydrogenase family protein, partial [Paracoccaceae bacterium]|nr:aldehyde dehydrogenase family protein [Paracoccaceae bacterium]